MTKLFPRPPSALKIRNIFALFALCWCFGIMKLQGHDDASGHPGFWGAQESGEPTPSSTPSMCLCPLGCFNPCGTLPPEGVGPAAPKPELELGSHCSESWAGRSWRSTGGMALSEAHGGPTEPGGKGHHQERQGLQQVQLENPRNSLTASLPPVSMRF